MGAGIIPAYAGSTIGVPFSLRSDRDHPRIRGEHDARVGVPAAEVGSSPHTRGAPARTSAAASRTSDHPRIRGEHRLDIPWPQAMQGSSPHTRGAPQLQSLVNANSRIIPAYAGSTRFWCRRRPRDWDHPRIRGEHHVQSDGHHGEEGSSPHTRGAPAGARDDGPRRRIIPAYAGSTCPHVRSPPAYMDHPRIRGEHGLLRQVPSEPLGSSPHTRGAQLP